MSDYAISLHAPHAVLAALCWRVTVRDVQCQDASIDPEMSGHYLWVPKLDHWTLDHLRMTLHELAAYLPPDDRATAGVVARQGRARSGRPRKDGTVRPPRFDDHVELWVEARGWRAEVWCWHDARRLEPGAVPPSPGEWSAPMQAVLLDLAAKSPFPLASVEYVEPEFGCHIYPARQDVISGDLTDYADERLERDQIRAELRELRRRIDDLLGDG